jgi:hypothetical protein
MRARSVSFLALLVGLLAAGCASSGPGGNTSRQRQDLLTREEIMGAGAGNLYEVIERLRPRWLMARGEQRSIGLGTGILVYQGEALLGDVEMLRDLAPQSAFSIRYLDGVTASTSLPGARSQHVAGAIMITTAPAM